MLISTLTASQLCCSPKPHSCFAGEVLQVRCHPWTQIRTSALSCRWFLQQVFLSPERFGQGLGVDRRGRLMSNSRGGSHCRSLHGLYTRHNRGSGRSAHAQEQRGQEALESKQSCLDSAIICCKVTARTFSCCCCCFCAVPWACSCDCARAAACSADCSSAVTSGSRWLGYRTPANERGAKLHCQGLHT